MAIPREVREVSVIPTSEQEQLAVGTTLGDGYIYPTGRLQLEHQERFKPYLLWKYEMLESLASGVPKRCVRFDKRTEKEYMSWRFYTKTVFKNYRELFYPDGRKIVPVNIGQLLVSPLSLAVWFMDDGGKGARTPKGVIISVNGFSISDRLLLRECLNVNFQLEVNLHNNGQIYIPAASYKRFYEIVASYIVPSMRYKLPVTP